MGLFDILFPKIKQKIRADNYFQTLSAYTPVFRTWNGELYESELVRTAIDARSRHIAKLKPCFYGAAQSKLVTKLKQAPNTMQTWYQFMYRLNTILDMQNTAFIVPEYNKNMERIGMITFLPERYELVMCDGIPWIRFIFLNGLTAAEELLNIGILTKFQYRNDYFGESNSALNATMNLINIQNQGIEEAVKNASTYRFMANVNNFTKTEDLANERKRFSEENLSGNGGGLLLFPNTYQNVKQITPNAYNSNSAERELIQKNVTFYYGVNEKILNNSATGDELDAFFNGAIEPAAIQLSEVITRWMYSPFEQSNGSYFVAVANRLQYMSITAKVSMSKELGDRGAIMIDEIRELFNWGPLPDGAGQHAPIRGEYYFAGEKSEEGEKNE
jgi:hypothetical protein